MKSNVTVFLEVYNEEKRIGPCLRTMSWADNIIIFDKCSTDATKKIASKYGKVISVPFSEGSENIVENLSKQESSEWCFFPTASSLMHPRIAEEIIKLTTQKYFDFDVIGIPYAMHSFGICHRRSPFFAERKYTLIRRSALTLSKKLHQEISFESKKIYQMPIPREPFRLYHCTHENVDSYLAQLIRYTRYEVGFDNNVSNRRALAELLRHTLAVLLKKKTFLLGHDGIALSLNYIIYFAVKYLRTWEKNRVKGDTIYKEIREELDSLWQEKDEDCRR